MAEDEQQFLLRQQQYLQQGGAPPAAVSGGSGLPSVQKAPDRKNMGAPGVQGSPKKVGNKERERVHLSVCLCKQRKIVGSENRLWVLVVSSLNENAIP